MYMAFACVRVHMRAATYSRKGSFAILKRRRRKTPYRRQSSHGPRPFASVRVCFGGEVFAFLEPPFFEP